MDNDKNCGSIMIHIINMILVCVMPNELHTIKKPCCCHGLHDAWQEPKNHNTARLVDSRVATQIMAQMCVQQCRVHGECHVS